MEQPVRYERRSGRQSGVQGDDFNEEPAGVLQASSYQNSNSASLDHPVVILAGEALEIVGTEKKIMMGRVGRSAYWLDHDPRRAGRGGLRSDDQVTPTR